MLNTSRQGKLPIALVSPAVRDELLARAVALDMIVSSPDVPLDPQTLRRIDIAFLSTDLMFGSSDGLAPGLSTFCDHLRDAVNLRWLHIRSAGADRPILLELLARGVRVTTSSGANAPEVSQSALAGFLALARGVPDWVHAQRRHEWSPQDGKAVPRDVVGNTAIVVGMGPIGREIALLLHALRLSVIGITRSAVSVPGCVEVLPYARIEEALPRADWLILACSLTPQTRGMIDAARLAMLPAGARVINVSRGSVVVEADLVHALQSGRLGGAYLDVFEHEPLAPDSPLWDMPGTLISSHRAGHSTGVDVRIMEMFLDNLRRWLGDAELKNEVVAAPARVVQ